MRAALPAIVLAAAGLTGCDSLFDPCFATAQRVKDLRVLALRTDPPEVVFEPGAPIAGVKLSALVVDPQTTDEVTVTGLLCPETKEKRCPSGSAAIGPVTGRAGTLSLDVQITHELLAAAREADPLKGYGGIRVLADLTVRSSFRRVLQASKLLLYTPAQPGYVPNRGFDITSLNIARKNGARSTLLSKDILQMEVPELLGIRPLLAGVDGGEAAEEYDVVDLSGKPARLREHISYSFFSTEHARFSADTADEPPSSGAAEQLVTLQPTEQAVGALYVVARDGRGAVAWFTAQWQSTDSRGDRKSDLEVRDCE